MLRDPVDRAYSQYWNDVREGIEKQPFLDALRRGAALGAAAAGAFRPCTSTAGATRTRWRRYLDRFGARVLVLFFEDYVRDPAGATADVLSFLGLRPADAGPRAWAEEPRLVAPKQARRGAARQRQGAEDRPGHGSAVPTEQAAGGSVEGDEPAPDGSRGASAAHGDLPPRGRATGRAARQASAVGPHDGRSAHSQVRVLPAFGVVAVGVRGEASTRAHVATR